jgi:type IV pilus assembly protein PilY1
VQAFGPGKKESDMKKWILMIIALIMITPGFIRADDTEIYGTVTSVSLEPNVLIIFDSSGSMDTADVPGEPYDPVETYDGSYTSDAVYKRVRSGWSYTWEFFAPDVNALSCSSVQDILLERGYVRGRINGSSPYNCGGTRKRLRTGNFMNYVASGIGDDRKRIDVAKEVVTDLINTTDGVRFGVMRFNNEDGGRVIAEVGSEKATLISDINAINADGWTPLAETLAEAGLYFAGKDSWFNAGVSYTSPMQERCQKNYVIIMTDGQPTKDKDSKLTSGTYINDDTIGDYDSDGSDPGSYANDGSDYLDDVAKYLYEKDCNPTLGDGTSFDKQNITTYTIGFQLNHELLEDTASNGGGEYYTATNYSELSEAFYQIMSSISEENAVFVAPVVPISRMNRTYAGDRIYLGFFKPQQSGRWIGNIKRYALDIYGTLYDANDQLATTPEGQIKSNALSFWTSLGNDGADVSAGGAAEVLNLFIEGTGTRNLYTYKKDNDPLLTDGSNAFAISNAVISKELLNVATETQRQDLINSVHDGTLGDIIHSEPVVVYYPDPDGNPGTSDEKTMIFSGSNDGILHCIDDDDGSEAWGFIPPDQLARLSLLDNTDHDYFVDGSPVVYYGASQWILIAGERRGGYNYTALDITAPTAPQYLYSIGRNYFDPDKENDPDDDVYERLGQSWAKPERATIATDIIVSSPGCVLNIETTTQDVFLMTGGYDNNQDQQTPAAVDTVGRALFTIDVASGVLADEFNFNGTSSGIGMTHSIVDAAALDHDGDGIVSRIYAGDLGGNVFAFKDDALHTFTVCSETVERVATDGNWTTAFKLFNASVDKQRKILYAPDAVGESFGETIFFGTGDRTDPGETGVVNRIYAVKNDWSSTVTLTESDLVDVTADLIQLGTEAEKAAAKSSLENGNGWYFHLENSGEKIVASPRVYGGVVYFTTYTPSSGSEPYPEDPCTVSTVRGVARLYAVDYKTGASVIDLNSAVEKDNDDKTVDLGKKDRSISIGTAIPSAPVIAILEGGAQIFIGVEGGIVSLPTISTKDMHTYFWTQIF